MYEGHSMNKVNFTTVTGTWKNYLWLNLFQGNQ